MNMSTHADRLALALLEAHPSMFEVGPADTLDEVRAPYQRLARRLVRLGVRLHQGDWEALREDGSTNDDAPMPQTEPDVVTVERVSNGYVVRHLGSRRSVAISSYEQSAVAATAEMLSEVNELIGDTGSRDDRERVRVITLPGANWMPTTADECGHPWVERLDADELWFCPCGAKFALEHGGKSLTQIASG